MADEKTSKHFDLEFDKLLPEEEAAAIKDHFKTIKLPAGLNATVKKITTNGTHKPGARKNFEVEFEHDLPAAAAETAIKNHFAAVKLPSGLDATVKAVKSNSTQKPG